MSSETRTIKCDVDELYLPPHHFKPIQFKQVSASDHLSLCSSSNSQFNTNCFTGVRVYDGAKILAAFLLTNTKIKKFLSSTTEQQHFNVLELGCGCGLGGCAALEAFLSSSSSSSSNNNNTQNFSITFTDMQPHCLELSQQNAIRVLQQHETTQKTKLTFEQLRWCPEGVESFLKNSASSSQSILSKFNLILAAELIYFRVDLHALVATIKDLLLPSEDSICLLCGINRLPNGRVLLPQIITNESNNMHYRIINMRPCLSECVRVGYFDDMMMTSLVDRADFVAIALNEGVIERVLGCSDEETENDVDIFLNEKSATQTDQDDGKKGQDGFENMSYDLF